MWQFVANPARRAPGGSTNARIPNSARTLRRLPAIGYICSATGTRPWRHTIVVGKRGEIRVAGAFDGFLHVARPAIVCRHRQVPVAKHIVQIAQVMPCCVRGFLGILAFVEPPGVAQTVFLSAVCYKLPHAAGSCARKRGGLKGAFRLRQVNQILWNAFFGQNRAIIYGTARAAQTGFHNGAAARGLEKIQERAALRRSRSAGRSCEIFLAASSARAFSRGSTGKVISATSSMGAGTAGASLKPSPARKACNS